MILIEQGVTFPSWAPGIGSDRFELKGEFTSAQAVTPGQGQSVTINGVKVGEISKVDLENDNAVVTMAIDDKYGSLIKSDATMLPRPRTGLNDMVIEIDPGTSDRTIEEDSTVPTTQTEAQVQPDEFLATLDADTRAYLQAAAQRRRPRAARARAGSSSRRACAASSPSRATSRRSTGCSPSGGANIARSIHNFRLISQALGDNDEQLASSSTRRTR